MIHNTQIKDENIKTVYFIYWFIIYDIECTWLIIAKLCLDVRIHQHIKKH